ncbi:probable cyclin-dependent serine/threonine-protein kinase DDB_G0292550 isoform X2 [Culicoides brevitarsis]|uniref:probable cyclin-dependent serine/threonine-protein kinase DDB_G0292550 isoform X2 n=1 Tax=Culicoides brevitarsis TaxID=469753 RepID=UPI00307CBF60
MSLEHRRARENNADGGLLVDSTQFLTSSSQANLITHHIPLDGQIFLHQSTNKINSRTNQFSIYNGTNVNNNMTAFTSTPSPTPIRSSKLLVLQQSAPHTNGLHSIQHETFIAENNMNGTATIVGSATSNNGNSQHIGDNIVLVTTNDHQLEITNSDHDIINNNNILSMANGNATTTTSSSGVTPPDEELTPLHWLTNTNSKDLLKGINLSCNNKAHPDSPNRPASSGCLRTPASDFTEESNISEENNSAVHYESRYPSQLSPSHAFYNNAQPQNLSVINRAANNVSPIELTRHHQVSSHHRQASSPTPSTSSSNSASTLSSLSPTNLTITVSSSTTNSSNSSSSSVSPHHTHFHKKYLRTQQMQEQQQSSSNAITAEGKTITITTEEIVRQQLQQQFVHPIVNSSSNYNSTLKHSADLKVQPPMRASDQKSETDCDEYDTNGMMYKNSGYSTPQSYSSSPVPDHEMNGKYEISPPKSQNGLQTNGNSSSNNKDKHPNNLPYDPQLHTNSKPPYSFSCLIFMAIEDSPTKALPVKEIYSWITQHFPYFKSAPNGWKNSVRHNLSLNKSFQKVEKAANLGKGSLWMVDDQYRPNLIQALTRSPFHPISPSIEKSVMKAANSMPSSNRSTPNKNLPNNTNTMTQPGILKDGSRLPDPQHFPFLARRLAAMETDQAQFTNNSNGYNLSSNGIVRENDEMKMLCDNMDDVNAAAAMLALKHGPGVFTEVFQDGEDHTYSSAMNGANGVRSGSSSSDANSNGTSSDAAYESGEESHNQSFYDIEEQRRLAEGADALLNLAGIATTNHCDTTNNTTTTTRSPAVKRLGSPEFNSHPYYSAANQTSITHNYSSPPKKHKSRMLKSKLKKKASWLR